jgi:diguanylate cyclase (GGDEF)-like protein
MRRIISILICLACCGGVASAEDDWDRVATPYFQHVGRENGLPHDIVMDFAQDRAGFVWIATQGGIARWDGYHPRLFTHVDGDPASLPDATILKLAIDAGDHLWAAASSGLVLRFDRGAGRFVPLPAPEGGIGVPYGLAEDGAGGVWIGGTDGLAHFADGHWQRETRVAEAKVGPIRCLMRSRDGALWICGATQLFRRSADGGAFGPLTTEGSEGEPVTALQQDAAGRIWFGTLHSAVGLLDPATGARRILVPAQPAAPLVRGFASSGPDEVWAATVGGGVLVVDAGAGLVGRLTAAETLPAALGSDVLYAVMQDRSGLMWVGGLGGAFYHPSGSPAAETVWPPAVKSGGGYGQDVLTLCADRAGRTWIGTLHGGLMTLGPGAAGGPALGPVETPEGMDSAVLDCAGAPDGSLLLSLRKGLLRLSVAGGKTVVEPLKLPEVEASGLVRSIVASGGDIWFGTDAGVFRTGPDGAVRGHWFSGSEEPGRLSNNSVETMVEDGAGHMWVGTHGGVDRIDEATGAVERIAPRPGEPDGLPGPAVSTLLLDRRGRLWVGTTGSAGIGVLDAPQADGPRRFRRISTAQGLPSDNIGTLLEDRAGRIWASSTDGLAVIDPDSFAIRPLAAADGVTIRSYWVHSGVALADGTMLFGGLKGLTVVHPDRLAAWSYSPPVRPIAVREGARSVPAEGPIVLEPSDRSLQVEFAALDYSAPGRNRYAYKLVGYDSDWVPASAESRLATYTNLPPGDYTLLLRGSNRDGVWTDPPTALAVTVKPAWNQTWWFALAEAVAVLLLILGAVWLRTLHLDRNRRHLEGEVARRTAEVEASRAALQDSNAALTVTAETLRRLSGIGRDITASLDMGQVFQSLARNTGAMMRADSISIWLLDPEGATLTLAYGIEDGLRLAPFGVALDDPTRGIARAARERREIMIEYRPGETPPIGDTQPMATALFGPLVFNDRLMGVMTVQCRRPGPYTERERLAFASLCAFGATALANAEAHRDMARANAELGRLATLDPLTGLANRRHFFATAAEEVARARRYGRPLSVLIADIDHFKRVNDTYGHAAGDAALQAAALSLAQCLRATDLAARFGGEEFVALLTETGIDGAAALAERFRVLLASTDIVHEGKSFRVTVSIGVSAWMPVEDGIARAIDRADAALYRVKDTGRDGVQVEPAPGVTSKPPEISH